VKIIVGGGDLSSVEDLQASSFMLTLSSISSSVQVWMDGCKEVFTLVTWQLFPTLSSSCLDLLDFIPLWYLSNTFMVLSNVIKMNSYNVKINLLSKKK